MPPLAVTTAMKPLQKLAMRLLQGCRGIWLLGFSLLSCCRIQISLSLRTKIMTRCSHSGVSGRKQNSWFHQLWASLLCPEVANHPQITTLLPPCLVVGMIFFWNKLLVLSQLKRDTQLPKCTSYVSSVHKNISQKSWGSWMWKWEEMCFFFISRGFLHRNI